MKPERVGGVKCFTRLLDWNTTGENLQADTTDISITCSLGMGAAIQKTYEEGLWYGRSHPAEETMIIKRYGRSHPKRLRYGRNHSSISHVIMIHKIAAWFATD